MEARARVYTLHCFGDSVRDLQRCGRVMGIANALPGSVDANWHMLHRQRFHRPVGKLTPNIMRDVLHSMPLLC